MSENQKPKTEPKTPKPQQTLEQKLQQKKERIEDLEYTFEYIVEDLHRYGIEPAESPGLQYLAQQIAEAASCDIDKVYEGIEHWSNGIWRKYG